MPRHADCPWFALIEDDHFRTIARNRASERDRQRSRPTFQRISKSPCRMDMEVCHA